MIDTLGLGGAPLELEILLTLIVEAAELISAAKDAGIAI